MSAPAPDKVRVSRYRSRRRKSLLRRNKIALSVAGILLYGCLMVAVASPGSFPFSSFLIPSNQSASSSSSSGGALDVSSDTRGSRIAYPGVDPIEVGKESLEGAQLASLASAADVSARLVDGEPLDSAALEEGADSSSAADSADSSEKSEKDNVTPPPGGGSVAPGTAPPSGMLYPIGRSALLSPSGAPGEKQDSPPTSPQNPPVQPFTQDPPAPSPQGPTLTQDPPPPSPQDPPLTQDPPPPTPQDPPLTQDPLPDGPVTEPVDAQPIQVPEPGTLTLLGPPILALWMLRRRRRRGVAD